MKKLVLLLCLLLSLCNAIANESISADNKTLKNLTKEEKIFGLTTVYHSAKYHFAYFNKVPDVDWDQAFIEFLPKVEKTQTLLEYYRILQEFVALLKDGHTDVRLPRNLSVTFDKLPIRLKKIDNDWVVAERFPSKEILEEDIPPGTIVLAINGKIPTDYFRENFYPYIACARDEQRIVMLNSSAFYLCGESVDLKLRSPNGIVANRSLCANRKSTIWTDDLRKKFLLPHRQASFFAKDLPGDIIYVRYGECTRKIQERFINLIKERFNTSPPSAMILDLRGNSGGRTPIGAVTHLISSPITWYDFKTRWSISYIEAQLRNVVHDRKLMEELIESKRSFMSLPQNLTLDWFIVTDKNRLIQPSDINFTGQLIILIDAETASAAEDMVVLLHAAKRAIVMGEASFGSTGQPLLHSLPRGGRLRVCTANCRYPDGREFIGIGIQPDVPIKLTATGIAEGKDEILESAINYIQKTQKKNPCESSN